MRAHFGRGSGDGGRTGDLQDEIRAAFTTGNFGRDVADRLGKRLARVRSLDDLLDLAAHLGQLLKPAQESWTVHGRERRVGMSAHLFETRMKRKNGLLALILCSAVRFEKYFQRSVVLVDCIFGDGA